MFPAFPQSLFFDPGEIDLNRRAVKVVNADCPFHQRPGCIAESLEESIEESKTYLVNTRILDVE